MNLHLIPLVRVEITLIPISPHFSPYLIHISWCFHVKFGWERLKFTSFESYRAYNIFYPTFRRNLWVFIERKTLELISKKNRGTTKHGVPRNHRSARLRSMTRSWHCCMYDSVSCQYVVHSRASCQCVVHGSPCIISVCAFKWFFDLYKRLLFLL